MGSTASQPLEVKDRELTVNLLRNNTNVLSLIFLFVFCAHLFHLSSVLAKENCIQYTNVLIESRLGKEIVSIQAEVADEPNERAIGLMNRKKIDKNKGMLFVYHYSSAPQFWMKNTLVSLDILFSDYEGRIIKIFENVPRMSKKKITAGGGVFFVLEVNSGMVNKFEIDTSWTLNLSDFFKTVEPFC